MAERKEYDRRKQPRKKPSKLLEGNVDINYKNVELLQNFIDTNFKNGFIEESDTNSKVRTILRSSFFAGVILCRSLSPLNSAKLPGLIFILFFLILTPSFLWNNSYSK